MSITRNRELSQFGSFIYIDNDNQSIGIATETLPYVGIGTTNPSVKLDVNGDTNIGGNVEASSYTLNGNPLVNVGVGQWLFGSNTEDIYRLMGNVGIGTSVSTEKLTVLGNVSAGKFISTQEDAAPFEVISQSLVTNLNADYLRGKTPPSGDIVGNDDNQILTNKNIDLNNNTITGTFAEFNEALSDAGLDFASTSGTETFTNKTLIEPIISGIRPSAGQLQIIPSGNGTLISTSSVNVITTEMIVDGTITNANISPTAEIDISKLSASTISGISLGGNLNNLTAGPFITYSSGTTYNGSSAITVSVAATSTTNTPNTLVARNSSGDFTAGTITGSAFNAITSGYRINGTTVINNGRNLVSVVNGNFTGIITATDFNSSSDINLKTNINTVENALDTVNSLRGVTFSWKKTGNSSIGVIAQELEEVLPELVSDGDNKSVNYNGLIGVLIEAVKSQQKEINNLKNEIELLKNAR